MIRLAVNSVIGVPDEEGGYAERHRIIWLSADGEKGFWIDLADAKSWPIPFERSKLEEQLSMAELELLAPGDLAVTPSSAAGLKRGQQLWKMCEPSFTTEPDIFYAKERAALLKQAAARAQVTLNTVRRLLQRFWREGKTPLGIYPRFEGRGCKPHAEPGSLRKLGRPPTTGPKGGNLTAAMKNSATYVIRAENRRTGRVDLPHCHAKWANLHFFEDGMDDKGQPSRVLQDQYKDGAYPTLGAFRKFYYRNFSSITLKRQADPKRYALQVRPLPSSATAETWGPGSRYLIDATMADIYLVSRISRRIIGRPVIYFVIDVWSRLIVGVYVTIEDASWRSAMFALTNAATSKVTYCARLGITISEDEWPAAGFGARLGADHGEVDSEVAAQLALHFNKIIEIAEAYRGDAKGLVETQFNTIQVSFGRFTPGYVDKSRDQRGRRDYRLDAVLDLDQFEATIVDMILARNSKTLANYDRDQGMPVDLVKATPLDLFHWGMANRSGRMHFYPDEYVRFHLLPTAEAPVDRHGLRFKGRHYLSPQLFDRHLMSAARLGRSEALTISYLPGCVDEVYLHSSQAPHGYEVCQLSKRSRAFIGMSMAEAEMEALQQQRPYAAAQTPDLVRKVNVEQQLAKRVAKARELAPKEDRIPSAQIKRGIKANRDKEKNAQRKQRNRDFSSSMLPEAKAATKDTEVSIDLAESNLADLIGNLS